MFRKHKSAPGDPGHIVPNTQGTSNEISFSVLHSMRNAAAEDGSPARPAWEFPHEEVKQRRARRRRSRRLMIAGMTLGIAALVAAGATILVINVQNQLDYVARMRGVLSAVDETCAQLAPFNEAVQAAVVQPMGASSYDSMKAAYDAAAPRLPQQADELAQLRSDLESALEHVKVPGDREAANQGITAVNAQLNLIELGQQLMADALPAHEAYAQAQDAMERIMEADARDEEATAAAGSLSAQSAQAARDLSQQAVDELQQAQTDLQTVQQCAAQLESAAGDDAPANMDALADYEEYVQLRLDAQQAAVASMQGYLDRNKEALQTQNERYNQLEQQAADLIADLPQAPADTFAALFSAAIESEADQWDAEHARLAAALEAVRSYLA